MLATQSQIDRLAERIEWVYRLRRPDWRGQATSRRLWAVAAASLCQAHEADPSVPIDPELFVASQPVLSVPCDPWLEITGHEAADRYASRVRSIIRSLRHEIRQELRRVESAIEKGGDPSDVILMNARRISPMGCYLAAHRAGLPKLARRFEADAAAQHESCPLYLEACRRLIGQADYPCGQEALGATEGPTGFRRLRAQQAHLN